MNDDDFKWSYEVFIDNWRRTCSRRLCKWIIYVIISKYLKLSFMSCIFYSLIELIIYVPKMLNIVYYETHGTTIL